MITWLKFSIDWTGRISSIGVSASSARKMWSRPPLSQYRACPNNLQILHLLPCQHSCRGSRLCRAQRPLPSHSTCGPECNMEKTTRNHDKSLVHACFAHQSLAVPKSVRRKWIETDEHGKYPIEQNQWYLEILNYQVKINMQNTKFMMDAVRIDRAIDGPCVMRR